MNATKDVMSMLISYKVDEDVDFSQLPARSGKGWAHWPSSLHHDKGQQDRQERAKSSQYRPVKLFTEKCEAVFKASERNIHYLTTLEDCQCLDYMRRGKPCKHMYRLAHELGQHNLLAVSSSGTTHRGDKSGTPGQVEKIHWYKKHGIIAALLLLFYPAGVVLMWKFASWTKLKKQVLAIVFGIIFVAILVR